MSGHPMIGEDEEEMRKKFGRGWADNEQKGIRTASESVLCGLKALNRRYRDQNGFVFIVCATGNTVWPLYKKGHMYTWLVCSGKSAEEMLSLLEVRIANSRTEELRIACIEQDKITQLRLQKLLQNC
eukprot:GHVS01084402.1.p1 GENE.GHVS01084402.1~~GHVS01084402.1.p1  ORF type:complete len:127 (-),score=13.37 GHVS01084402.1:53-433(-)